MFLLLLCLLPAGYALQPPVVRVEQGDVRGGTLRSLGGRAFFAFQGIPYAQPPVGHLRFQEPLPAKAWHGVWNATTSPGMCLQASFSPSLGILPPIMGEEDCLYINVFTPRLPEQNGKSPMIDVIVYIHGGAFMSGSSTVYKPTFYMDYDVIVVTFNYRLGILGFLSTEDEIVPGNNGLKDQSLALKWIKNNIAAFGGNPDSITVTGTSAGGASVHYHYLSPMSKGLFHRGTSWSGCALHPWAQAEGLREKSLMLGKLVGCDFQTSLKLIECLRERPAKQLVEQTGYFRAWRINPFSPFGPTVEVGGNNPFIDTPPVEVILKGNAQNLPWMTSITTEEGLVPAADFLTKEEVMEELDTHFTEIAPYIFDFNYTVSNEHKTEVSKKIREFYLGHNAISGESRREIIKMLGDRLFSLDVERAARLQSMNIRAPIYFYEFGYRGKCSLSDFLSQTKINLGVCHVDDTFYIMDTSDLFCKSTETEEDMKMIKLMTDICINYAKSGDPTPSNSEFKWTPVVPDSKNLEFLQINNPSNYNMKSSPDFGNKDFWDSLPIDESQITIPNKLKIRDDL